MEANILMRGACALAFGLIIGFQREQKQFTLAGIRTFPILSLIGFFCALLEQQGVHWVLFAGILAVTAVVVKGMSLTTQEMKGGGVTTEMTAIFVVLLGASFALLNRIEYGIVAGGVCAILLQLKQSMHGWVKHLNTSEVQGIMQFVLVAFVILPLLPDKTYDEFNVLNPQKIWLIVVIINGISLVSFSIQKIIGEKTGTILTGVLGGLISSTATTVTTSKRSAKNPKLLFLIPAMVIASTAVFVRIFSEILIAAPATFSELAIPLSLFFLIMIVLSFISYKRTSAEEMLETATYDPSHLKAAIVFSFLFAVILYTTAWARHRYGEQGLYVVSLISGLIDVDAVTLSSSQMVEEHRIGIETGWKLILTGILSNMVFKTGIVLSMAKGKVRNQVVIYFIISLIAGLGILFIK